MARTWGLTEKDTCGEYVIPALKTAGWSEVMITPEYPVKAKKVISSGGVEREIGDGRVDYVLEAKPGVPVAVVEAKREYRSPSQGLQQAIRYAQQLDTPLAYSTNGHGFVERNLRTGRERDLDALPTPPEMWAEYVVHHELNEAGAALVAEPFNRNGLDVKGNVREPRWYQTKAVHRVLHAIASDKRRVLLLMATGTGKTFTAMQIVAKLREYERVAHPQDNYRVLYLADLDVLLKQPMGKDFRGAFGAQPLHRVKGSKNTSREIFFASYQALTGFGTTEDATDELFQNYPRDFFDLVIVDEAHRGSARAGSSWRRILEHFSSAVQLGLTATPKRDGSVDTYAYFGNPVFEYTLRQGIEDGYLAPYRVRRVLLSPDVEGWEPDPGELDKFGRDIPEGTYTTRDFERVVSLLKRTDLAAWHLSKILRANPGRAMVFCLDQQHAEDMRRAMVKANPDLVRADHEWVVRIVGSEQEKARLLDDYTDPDTASPVVATTSRLLSTGVDVPDLKYVVLFRPIGSMVEFKQIIGRGTRLYPDKGKTSFTILDYVGATALFNDPEFDGYPAQDPIIEVVDDRGDVVETTTEAADAEPAVDTVAVAEPDPGFTVTDPPSSTGPTSDGAGGEDPQSPDGRPAEPKLVVEGGQFFIVGEGVQVPDTSTGRMVLVEFEDYVKGTMRRLAGTADELSSRWAKRPGREAVLAELAASDIDIEDLVDGATADYDILDVLLQIAYNQPAQTRAERVRNVRARHATDIEALSEKAQQVLDTLLAQYAEHGIADITSPEALSVAPLRELGSPVQIAKEFGGARGWHQQIADLQEWLYSA